MSPIKYGALHGCPFFQQIPHFLVAWNLVAQVDNKSLSTCM